jgi:hypothetical protein
LSSLNTPAQLNAPAKSKKALRLFVSFDTGASCIHLPIDFVLDPVTSEQSILASS